MLGYYFLIPFAVSILISIFHRKAGYISLAVSSIIFFIFAFTSFTYLSSFIAISSMVWIFASIFSISYGKKYGRWLAPLFSLTVFGMATILVSTTYIQFISGWEVMSMASYAIIGLNRKDSSPPFIFMGFSELSTIFIIAGAAISFSLTGTISIVSTTSMIPMVLFTMGALVKMGMVPFMISEWLPIAHGNAPANASAILSGTMTLMGVYFIVRMMFLSPLNPVFGIILITIGVISVIFASLFAYVSDSPKMLAGFSTVENNGAILAAIGFYMIADTPLLMEFALATIVIFALSHSLSKSLIFAGIGASGMESFHGTESSGDPMLKAGMFMGTASLSGLFPTIGGLGTWMILEMFFMGALEPGFYGIVSIAAGSAMALGEGFAAAAMMKVLKFTSMGKMKDGIDPMEKRTVYYMGVILVALFAASPFFIYSNLIGGIPSVLVFNGFTIQSMYSSTDFGLISPDYVLSILVSFFLVWIIVFGRPKGRIVPTWNNGRESFEPYNSYAYSNNIRLMLRKILRTDTGHMSQRIAMADVFWIFTLRVTGMYKKIAKFFTLGIMNSSIRWYMVYMIVAFVFVLLFAKYMG